MTRHIILIVQFAMITGTCAGLECWKCIGKSCDQNPTDNYRASTITCRQGESCMKVYYRQSENGSRILESTTRSCSTGRCVSSTHSDFHKCLHTKRQYNVLGCALRTCCHDSDLCNDATTIRQSSVLLIPVVLLTVSHMGHLRTF